MWGISPKGSSGLQLFQVSGFPETNTILNHNNLKILFWNKPANGARCIQCGPSNSGIVGGVGLDKVHLLSSLICAVTDQLLGFQTLHPLLLCKSDCGCCSQLTLTLTITVVWANVYTTDITVRLSVIKAWPTAAPQGETVRIPFRRERKNQFLLWEQFLA